MFSLSEPNWDPLDREELPPLDEAEIDEIEREYEARKVR